MKLNFTKILMMFLLMMGTTSVFAVDDFTIDLTKNPIGELPAGVERVSYSSYGLSYNGSQHGWMWFAAKFAVDGPVKITVGGCQYINTGYTAYVTDGSGNKIADIDNKTPGCSGSAVYNYTGSATTLIVYCGQYCTSLSVKNVTSPSEEPTPGEEATASPLLWDYTEAAPSSSPNNGLTYSATVSDAAGKNNGLKGIKINSSGYAYFTKETGAGTLKLTFGPRSGSSATSLSVYTFTETAKDETLIKTTDAVTELKTVSIPLAANQNNIYIKRNPEGGAEAVLTKIQFVPARKFVDFKLNFTKSWASSITQGTTYYVTATDAEGIPTFSAEQPTDGKYLCTFKGKYHSTGYGITSTPVFTVPTDGAVKVYYGMNDYGSDITVKNKDGETVLTGNSKGAKFSSDPKNVMSMTYAKGEDVLTFTGGGYVPYFAVEAVEVQEATITYKDQNGTVLGTVKTTEGEVVGDIPYSESDLTIAEGSAFRGWVYSSGKKAKSTDVVNGNTTISAHVTPIETVTVGSVQNYPLTNDIFYPEDHETISTTGGYYHDSSHGWAFANGESVSVQVAGNAQVILSLCQFSKDNTIAVTDAEGNTVETIASGKVASDGTTYAVNYTGPATTLTITYTEGESYLHKIAVYNVKNFLAKDETSGYYVVPAGDAASLVLAINSVKEGDKIFLPNGTYDLGETALTTISANNVSIIGESMEGTIIKNAPDVKNEGIGTTATLLNTSNNLYIQDLTIQNALDYYASGSAGRAVCLQDKGSNTICKNVKMLSYQDTYYSNKASNFYWEDSEIHGTVDYLCGDGNVVYNRVKLVNESREKTAGKGDCTICAPYTSASCQYGYVFLNCTIDTKSATFNLGRAWGGKPRAAYLNTTILQPSKIADSRFTVKGMNVVADSFKEYNSIDESGNVISPVSNELTFTYSSTSNKMETILTATEAAQYTLANIYGEWNPDQIAAQVTNPAEGTVFLVDGAITTTLPTSGSFRVANARGGFGPEVTIPSEVEIKSIGWASFASPVAMKVPEGTKAYVAESQNGNEVILKEVEVIPANTGVLISGSAGTYTLSTTESAEPVENNLLSANLEKTIYASESIYVLAGATGDTPVFKKYTGTTLAANKAYINASDITSGGAKVITFVIEDATAIQNVSASSEEVLYNVAGQRVKAGTKGLIISNNKKVLVK